MAEITEDMIERAAKALAGISPDTSWSDCEVWGDLPSWVDGHRARARAALTAAGVAPQEPSACPPASSPDREKLIRDAQKAVWAEIHGQDPRRRYSVAEVKHLVYSLDNAISDALDDPVEPSCAICGDGLPSLLAPDGARVDPVWALRFGVPREANVCPDCYRTMRDRWHAQNPDPAAVDEAKLTEIVIGQLISDSVIDCWPSGEVKDLAEMIAQAIAEWLGGGER